MKALSILALFAVAGPAFAQAAAEKQSAPIPVIIGKVTVVPIPTTQPPPLPPKLIPYLPKAELG